MKKQVAKDYYFNKKYLNLERFISYYYQIDTIRSVAKSGKILFIGPGDKIVSDYLNKVGFDVDTFDIDKELEPSYVGDVRDLSFSDNEYDIVVAFEVLEHVPFDDFQPILEKMNKIAKQAVLISIPNRLTSLEFLVKFPGIRSLFKKEFVYFSIDKYLRFPGFEVSGQHYWEIDKKEFNKKRVGAKVKEVFGSYETRKPILHRYQTFYTMKK